jgi:hypothetical protein
MIFPIDPRESTYLQAGYVAGRGAGQVCHPAGWGETAGVKPVQGRLTKGISIEMDARDVYQPVQICRDWVTRLVYGR